MIRLTFTLLFALTSFQALAAGPAPAGTPLGKIGDLDFNKYRGKVILVDFWATWCKPCRIAAPALRDLNNKYKDKGFVMLSLSSERDTKKVERVAKADGMDWTHYSDITGAVHQSFRVRGLPTYVVVDQQGNVIERLEGWHPRYPQQLDKKIAEALDKPAK